MWWRSRRSKLADLDAELRGHLEMATQERIARGESPADAARHAREQLGNVTTVREVTGDMLRGEWLEHLVGEVRYALRGLLHAPAFSVAATLTLVVGIGAAAATLAIVRGVLFEPLPYRSPDRLFDVWQDVQWPTARRLPQMPSMYFTYRQHARSIESVGAYQGVGSANIRDSAATGEPERVAASWMSASMFTTLQVAPLIGRTYTEEEDRPEIPPRSVVLSERIWRSRFGGARDIIGKTMIVNEVPRVIVGVMPDRFRFPTSAVRLWLPARLNPNTQYGADFGYTMVARLRPGITPEAAQHEFAALLPSVAETYPGFEPGVTLTTWVAQARPVPVVVPLRDDVTEGFSGTLWMLAAAAAIVLFVAWANVANLLLIRADARQAQIAVREALGASRFRIGAHLFAETATLTMIAGALGLFVAWIAVSAVASSTHLNLPRATELDIDVATAAATLAIVVIIALTCSAIVASRSRGQQLLTVLRGGSPATTAGKSQHRLRSTIAALQIGLALVALNGSALLVRTFQRLRDQSPGFDAPNVETFWMQLPGRGYGSDSEMVNFYAQLTERVAALPGVQNTGITSRLPLGGGTSRSLPMSVDANTAGTAPIRGSVQAYTVDSGYFDALRIPLLAGQLFANTRRARELDVVISRSVARDFWHDATGRAAVGERFRLGDVGPTYSVVGVVEDVRDRALELPPLPTVYAVQAAPADTVGALRARRTMALLVRSNQPTAMIPAIKATVREMDPTLPTFDIQSMGDVLEKSTERLSVVLMLMSVAALVTLVLGAIGLYGVMAYVVVLRSRELSLRVVLGADPRSLARMMAVQGLRVAAVGMAMGIVVFAMISQSLRAFLYGIGANDPATLLVTTVTLLAIAALATWLPARRAARVDPKAVLRSA
jgi:predicted permease